MPATATTTGTATASQDPNKGIVYLLVGTPGKNGTTDMVQASGVLIAPDEILTAAHVAYGTAGLRSAGTAIVGYNKGTYAAIGQVDAVHVLAKADYTTNAGDAKDYAVIHLKTPVTGGTIFQLGQGGGAGTYNVSGYPAGTGGALDTQSEALTMDGSNSLYKGVPLNQGSNNPHGSSGGPVWQTINGKPTVLGDVSSMTADGKTGWFKQLTASDVSQIQAWEKADHSTVSTVVNGTATPAAVASSTATGATKKTDATVLDAGVFGDALASMVSGDASSAHGTRATVISDVSAAITKAAADGGSFADMFADATSYLNDNSSVAGRAVAYLGGLLASVTGGQASTMLGDVDAALPDAVSGADTRTAAIAGFREGSNASAADLSGLASAIAGTTSVPAASTDAVPAASMASPALVASALDAHRLAA